MDVCRCLYGLSPESNIVVILRVVVGLCGRLFRGDMAPWGLTKSSLEFAKVQGMMDAPTEYSLLIKTMNSGLIH